MAAAVSEAAPGRAGGRATAGPAAVDHAGPGRGRGRGDLGGDTPHRHALVTEVDGREVGLSKSTIGRIWRDFGLKPHLADTFKLSTDPLFVEKVVDVVGLYLDPPAGAVVLSVDEKARAPRGADGSRAGGSARRRSSQ
jgi:hypothetical protein